MTTHRAYRGHCHHCAALLLVGPDEDMCAFQAAADPAPLTALGEALALLAGRRTYELRQRGGGVGLYRRDRWQITSRKAGTQFVVLADHQCNTPPLPTAQTTTPEKERVTNAAQIPF